MKIYPKPTHTHELHDHIPLKYGVTDPQNEAKRGSVCEMTELPLTIPLLSKRQKLPLFVTNTHKQQHCIIRKNVGEFHFPSHSCVDFDSVKFLFISDPIWVSSLTFVFIYVALCFVVLWFCLYGCSHISL